MVLFWTVFKKRVFFLYLFVCIIGTVLIAYAFQFMVFVPNVDVGNPLLRGVRSVSGGRSSVIRKLDGNARIVMDPGGKGLIATYTNDAEGSGGIVFDADVERFSDASADKFDNRAYIRNVAEWLEQTSGSDSMKRILIYAPGGLFGGRAVAALEQAGFSVKTLDGRGDRVITEAMLADCSQIWVIFGAAGGARNFSETELAAISGFTGRGGGMLIATGAGGVDDVSEAATRLSSRYGAAFSGETVNREELTATTAVLYYFQRASGMLGGLLKFVHKA